MNPSSLDVPSGMGPAVAVAVVDVDAVAVAAAGIPTVDYYFPSSDVVAHVAVQAASAYSQQTFHVARTREMYSAQRTYHLNCQHHLEIAQTHFSRHSHYDWIRRSFLVMFESFCYHLHWVETSG